MTSAYEARAAHRSILWLHYSPKAKRDFAFASDLDYGHFLLVESDPAIVGVDYAPSNRVATLVGTAFETMVSAEVTYKSGEIVWRDVKPSEELATGQATRANLQLIIQTRATASAVARHEVFTEKEIYANPTRIRNWHRVVHWIAAARSWALHDFSNQIALTLRVRGRAELRELLSLGTPSQASLYGAALFEQVQRGIYSSDLSERPLSPRSVFATIRGQT
jgi:hypothetical protein